MRLNSRSFVLPFLAAWLIGVALLIFPVQTLDAQDDVTRVVFIEEPRDLAMSSVTDPGPDGLTRLADMFRARGALVEWIRLRDTIPLDVDVIVLVRPRRQLSVEDTARIWMQVGAGASLLVAIDPNGYLGGRTELARGGLNTLTMLDQSVTMLDGILIEQWFTSETLTDLRTTLSVAQPDPVSHPVIDPLRMYDLPLMLWGARPVTAEPFGVDSVGWSLAITEPVFAESSSTIYPRGEESGDPIELNIGVDPQGRLSVAGLGENLKSGARVAVLGDAEIVQNGYGLAVDGAGSPLYAGNAVMTERIVSWLMHEEAYLDLPSSLSWLAIDGADEDWAENAGRVDDDAGDTMLTAFDINGIRGIRTDAYAYLLIETTGQAHPNSEVTLDFDVNQDGQAESVITLNSEGATVQSGEGDPAALYDAAFAAESVIELRVPLRVVNPVTAISRVCLNDSREMVVEQQSDCYTGQLPIPLSAGRDPAPLRVPFGTPMATVTTDGVNRANVRSGPETAVNVVGNLDVNRIVAVIGRNEASDWLYVQTAALEGWINAGAVKFVGDLEQVPVR